MRRPSVTPELWISAFKGFGDATVSTVKDPLGAGKNLVDGTMDMGKGVVDGTVAAVTDPLAAGKGLVDGTVSAAKAVGDGTMAVAGTTLEATVALANDTIDAGATVVDLSTGAIEKSFELLGVTEGRESRLVPIGHQRT